MLEYKKRILEKEFSFLKSVSEIIENDFNESISLMTLDQVSVKRGDENLLLRKGSINIGQFGYIYDRMSYSQCEVFFAVLGQEVTKLPAEGTWREDSTTEELNANTICEELLKLNIAPEFIVAVKWSKDDDGNCFNKAESLDDSSEIVIYKMKDFDLLDFHKNNFIKAAKELAAEL